MYCARYRSAAGVDPPPPPPPQEVVILTLSTLWWEEQSLSVVNMVGMAVCVAGVSLHVLLKALRAKRELLHYYLSSKQKEPLFGLK